VIQSFHLRFIHAELTTWQTGTHSKLHNFLIRVKRDYFISLFFCVISLFNPSPRYEDTLICTQERVFPLQTMVLVFYVFCVTMMLLLRPIVNDKIRPKIEKCSLAIYYALYAFPILALIHSLFGGLVYYSFPYLSIVISCAANASHFALKLDQSTKGLIVSSVTDIRNILIIGKFYQYFFETIKSS
jgi:hypothetical protein